MTFEALRQAILTHPKLSDRECEDLIDETYTLEAEAKHHYRERPPRVADPDHEGYSCSFCGLTDDRHDGMRIVIVGPNEAALCNECAEIVVEIIAERRDEQWAATMEASGSPLTAQTERPPRRSKGPSGLHPPSSLALGRDKPVEQRRDAWPA